MSSTKVFLVTANIASCFDNPKPMLNIWLDEFFKVIAEKEPQFVALHCQEVGGKNYETCMENVDQFLRNIVNRATGFNYTKIRIFIDEEFTSAEKFTALGSLYLIKSEITDVQIWNFGDRRFVDVEGQEEYVGNIEDVPLKEKSKFPQEFFPECKWSRKGFLRTRWCLNGTQFDLVNIHLFHDASNFIAMEKFPSVYTLNRKRAMEHTLDRFHNDALENVPIFLFGDFNFRLDTGSVVQKLTEECRITEDVEVSGEKTREFRDKMDQKSILSVSKKSFSHADHSSIFLKDNGNWLRPFDKELSEFAQRLQEFPIKFPPSYPFEEGAESKDNGGGEMYMKTRCPSWCDRVILNQSAKDLIDQENNEVLYDIIGLETRMGDHKPVGLCVHMPSRAGIVRCCSTGAHCPNFVHDPQSSCFILGAWCCCQAYPVNPSNGTPTACPAINPVPNNLSALPPDQVEHPTTETAVKDGPPVAPPRRGDYPTSGGGGSDLLKNVLKLNGKMLEEFSMDGKGDPLLKRVHSDPVKVRNYCDQMKGAKSALLHSNLIHSHSLDGAQKGKGGPTKLRLRSSSSRLISHHSSSSEEWFEEVPPNEDLDEIPRIQGKSVSSNSLNMDCEDVSDSVFKNEYHNADGEEDFSSCTENILKPPKLVQQQNSLNNLLFSDSKDVSDKDTDYICDVKSVSNFSYQTDCSSIHKASETNSSAFAPFRTDGGQRSISDSNTTPPFLDNEANNPSVTSTASNISEKRNSKALNNCCCSVS